MRTVLIVDDEPHVLRVLKLSLSRAGYIVNTALDGAEALQKLGEQSPDALITDMKMPKISGKDLCQKLCERYPGKHVPLFVMTSRAEGEYREWLSELTNIVFLEKPLSPRKMIRLLAEHLPPL